MSARIFRDLVRGEPVLEIGRLRLWALRGPWPEWPYFERTPWGTTLFGAGYLAGMWFNRPRESAAVSLPGDRT